MNIQAIRAGVPGSAFSMADIGDVVLLPVKPDQPQLRQFGTAKARIAAMRCTWHLGELPISSSPSIVR